MCSRIEKKVQHCSTFFLAPRAHNLSARVQTSTHAQKKMLADFSTRTVKNSEWKTAYILDLYKVYLSAVMFILVRSILAHELQYTIYGAGAYEEAAMAEAGGNKTLQAMISLVTSQEATGLKVSAKLASRL